MYCELISPHHLVSTVDVPTSTTATDVNTVGGSTSTTAGSGST